MKTNLYAKIVEGQEPELIMPDKYGEMQAEAPTGEGMVRGQWPVNPQFSGPSVIKMMLKAGFAKRELITNKEEV